MNWPLDFDPDDTGTPYVGVCVVRYCKPRPNLGEEAHLRRQSERMRDDDRRRSSAKRRG